MLRSLLGSLDGGITYLFLRYQNYTVSQYYEQVTRASMQSLLQNRMLEGDYDDFVSELRYALRKQNVVHQVFEDFAVNDADTGHRGGSQVRKHCLKVASDLLTVIQSGRKPALPPS